MNKPKKKNRFLKPIIITIVLFILLVLAGNFYISTYLKKQIQDRVEAAVKGKYIFQIGTFDASIFRSSISAQDVAFIPYDIKLSDNYTFIASSIIIEDISLYKFFTENKLIAGALKITSPVIKIHIQDKSQNIDSTNFSLYDMIAPKYHSLLVKSIRISNPDFQYYLKNDSVPAISSSSGNIAIDNLIVDSSTTGMNTKIFKADDFNITLDSLKYLTSDGMYTISTRRLLLSYVRNKLEMDSLIINPNYGKYEFARKHGSQVDRIDIKLSKLTLVDADLKSLTEFRNVHAAEMKIDNAQVYVFRDKHIASIDKKKLTIQALLKFLPLDLKIDSVFIKNSNLTYEERNEQSKEPGYISFNDLNSRITGISSSGNSPGDNMTVTSEALMYGKGKLKTQITFPLYGDTNSFYCKGSLGKMHMDELNAFLKNNAFVYVTNGVIDTLNFSFKGGDQYAKGNLTFLYHDLRVAMKEKNQNDTTNIIQKAKSFLVNTFVINSDNPKKKNDVHSEQILYKRDPNRFIFSYCWKSILSGIKKTLGVPGS